MAAVDSAGASFNAAASDLAAGITPDTLPMRNQAQTHQVELQGNGTMNFALGFETGAAQTYDSDARWHSGLVDTTIFRYTLTARSAIYRAR